MNTVLQQKINIENFDQNGPKMFGIEIDEILACLDSADAVCDEAHRALAEQQAQRAPTPLTPTHTNGATKVGSKSCYGQKGGGFYKGRGYFGKGSLSSEMQQARLQLLELMREQVTPKVESMFEATIGELKNIEDEDLERIDEVGDANSARAVGIGELGDLAETFAAEAYFSSSPWCRACQCCCRCRKPGRQIPMGEDEVRIYQLATGWPNRAGRTAATNVREISAWWAVRASISLQRQLQIAGIRAD